MYSLGEAFSELHWSKLLNGPTPSFIESSLRLSFGFLIIYMKPWAAFSLLERTGVGVAFSDISRSSLVLSMIVDFESILDIIGLAY